MKKTLQYIFAIYLFAYLVDGVLSVLDDLFELVHPLDFLHTLRSTVASHVIIGALFCYLLLSITSLFRKRLYIVVILFPLIYVIAVGPIMICLGRDMTFVERVTLKGEALLWRSPQTIIFGLFLSLFQALSGLWAFMNWRKEMKEDREDNNQSGFSVKFCLAFWFINGGLALLLVPTIILSYLVLTVDTLGRDFVHMDSKGLSVVQRHLVKEDREIVLVPMVHIGKQEFYRQLSNDVQGEDTLVLFEGISDKKNRIETAGPRTKLAKLVGLSDQPEHFNPMSIKRANETTSVPEEDRQELPDIMRADVDSSEFAEETIEFINCSEQLLKRFEAKFLNKYLEIVNNRQKMKIVLKDLIDKRNKKLVDCILERELSFKRLVVPWGVFHLHDVEQMLLKEGYKRGKEELRLIIPICSRDS